MRMQLAVQRRRIHQHNRRPIRLAGTSLPKLTTAVPLCVSDPVLAVSSVRAVSASLAADANPSSSTVRLVVDTTLGTESAATVTVSVEDEVSPSWSVIV